MKLVHRDDELTNPYWNNQLTISCDDGMQMAATMHRVERLCQSDKSDYKIIWDTQHHTVNLWFENPRHIPLFEIQGIA